MPSELDFEAAGSSDVCYCLSIFFASEASSHCKHDMGALSWLNLETLERVPSPVYGTLVRCSPRGALSRDYGVCYQCPCWPAEPLTYFGYLLDRFIHPQVVQ